MSTYRRARPVGEVTAEGPPFVKYVAALPDGPPLVLEASAALIWECLPDTAELITADAVAAQVAAVSSAEPAEIHADVVAFLDALVSYGVADRRD